MLTRRSRPTLAATLLTVVLMAGCVDAGPRTAYCGPADPVVAPAAPKPGSELRVEVSAFVDADGCEQNLPDGARYEIRLTSERTAWDSAEGRYTETLGVLQPDGAGEATGTLRLPDEVPPGGAEVSVDLTGAETICETDPTMQCAQHPFAWIDITG
ncbi:hypothetical protein SAMN05216184_11088 [Georgenia satyanarayanai]|uniref:Uncharacterized protein n=1 Tax=Georgenia satyanarayanai TaxID=860221 RepID=A0A2Y9AQP7_9MICO|nr:hypothetical protein [Georgenia satyanarayanai]PYF98949.1 hypothetical protein A8987_11088 [Georgenia satyanarayanai]SSA44797.1 hypothetical protein SAMN05216184_11088 [Georgenia satyanarayanai]